MVKLFEQSDLSIKITLELTQTVAQTKIKASIPLNVRSKIKTKSGKILSNEESSIDYKGYVKLEGAVKGTIAAASIIAKSSGIIASTSSGIVVFSSFFSNSLGFLSKMIQIIEFTALMNMFNVQYDSLMAIVLAFLDESTQIDLLDAHFKQYFDKPEY